MLWSSGRNRKESAAVRFRREHEAFLTRAIRLDVPYPRIPTRRVDQGGFDRLRARGGQERAERWWRLAIDAMARNDVPHARPEPGTGDAARDG